jgi:hypothetical protein
MNDRKEVPMSREGYSRQWTVAIVNVAKRFVETEVIVAELHKVSNIDQNSYNPDVIACFVPQ